MSSIKVEKNPDPAIPQHSRDWGRGCGGGGKGPLPLSPLPHVSVHHAFSRPS